MNMHEGIKIYERESRAFKIGQYKLPLRLLFQKRAFHALCLGTPKSGTHSIANMFKEFRSSHEPNEVFMINLINKKAKGLIPNDELNNILKSRDISNWLEMESSHYLGIFVEQLITISNDVKFILTIRDCLSWMDSWFNHQLSRPTLADNSVYDLGRNNYYSRGHEYTKHDEFLKELKLYPIRSYLEYWNTHNSKIIETVDKDRLLIIKTHQISESSNELSVFLNINKSLIDTNSSHEFTAKAKHEILKKLDTNFLHDTAMEVCGDLNDKYLPEKAISNILEA